MKILKLNLVYFDLPNLISMSISVGRIKKKKNTIIRNDQKIPDYRGFQIIIRKSNFSGVITDQFLCIIIHLYVNIYSQ